MTTKCTPGKSLPHLNGKNPTLKLGEIISVGFCTVGNVILWNSYHFLNACIKIFTALEMDLKYNRFPICINIIMLLEFIFSLLITSEHLSLY